MDWSLGPMHAPLADAEQALGAGRFAQARDHALQAIAMNPLDEKAKMVLASANLGLGRFEEAADALRPLASAYPHDSSLQFNYASALRGLRRLDEALQVVDNGLGVAPGDAQLIGLKARLLTGLRRSDAAAEILLANMDTSRPSPPLAIQFARLAEGTGAIDAALSHLDACLPLQMPPPMANAVRFARADLLEASGRYEEAFEAYVAANQARRMPWDVQQHTARIDAMIEAWSAPRLASLPRADVRQPACTPIFIVGMPRSATTLIDQTLSMHPQVHAGGEQMTVPRLVMRLASTPRGVLPLLDDPGVLAADALSNAATTYLDAARALSPDEPMITDKFPQNALHLGLISLMFPGAKVIHCQRDPLDTCVSCFFHNFLGAMPYMYDLEHIGAFYNDYRRLMDHWRDVLDLDILDVTYETLVADQEAQVRRVLEHLDLEWEPACLEFHTSRQAAVTASETQVARPLHAGSVARWHRHAGRLGALARALGDRLPAEHRASFEGSADA